MFIESWGGKTSFDDKRLLEGYKDVKPSGGYQEKHPLQESYHLVPACFMFANIKGLMINNIRIIADSDISFAKGMPGVYFIRVIDGTVRDLYKSVSCKRKGKAEICIENSKNIIIQGCHPQSDEKIFLLVSGMDTENIVSEGNVLPHSMKPIKYVDGTAVR